MRFIQPVLVKAGLRRQRRRKLECVEATESLEQRALLTSQLVGTTLLVEGTDAADTIVITQSQAMVMVQENDEPVAEFPVGQVSTIRILGLGGADTITTRKVPIRARVDGGPGDDMITGGDAANELKGGGGDDTIIGFDGPDVILGGGGNDVLRGQRGDDNIRGGSGADTIFGAADQDSLNGGGGADFIKGAGDNDTILGEGGNDTLIGSAGFDSIRGGDGADEIDGGFDEDTLRGGAGPDLIEGGPASDMILGSGGDDTLHGGTGRDVMVGGEGRDSMTGGTGQDLMISARRNIPDPIVNGKAVPLPEDLKLAFVALEWRSDKSYDERVANIRKGEGRTDARLNDDFYLIGLNRGDFPTVFNDFGYIDSVFGEEGRDYFFLAEGLGDDDITDRDIASGERREKI